MENDKPQNPVTIGSVKKVRPPLNRFGLFQPVQSAFLENLTTVEQLAGMWKKINEIITQLNLLTQVYEEFPEQIESLQFQINNINDQLTATEANLKSLIQSTANQTLKAANTYTDLSADKLNIRIDNISKEYPWLFDPSDGKREPIQTVINHIYDVVRISALTAKEYDDLEMTAETYDNKELTAYDYDNFGKTLLTN